MGAQAHPQLLAEFGGAMTGRAADYVRAVGQKVVAQTGGGARAEDYTITLLNSPVLNAMALPGGYVYISRQLLALMNDEAELASVLGHEVGHITARHSQRRQSRSQMSSILAGIAGVLTGSQLIGQGANMVAQLTTLGFSREQERQADSIGTRYIAALGYDPMASGEILAALAAQTRLEAQLAGRSGQEPSAWLATHPNSAERVARINREAQALIPKAGQRRIGRDALLDAIDGLPYDDDASQGVVQGRSFRHAGLALALDAPAGVTLRNSPAAVTAAAENGASFDMRLADGRGSLDQIAAARWQAIGAPAQAMQPAAINGLEAIQARVRANSRQGPVEVGLTVVRWSPTQALSLLTVAPDGQGATMDPLVRSLRRLSAAEAAAIRTRRIQVVRVAPGDTPASLAARMAYDDDRMARFLTLNQLDANSVLKAGERVKLVVWR